MRTLSRHAHAAKLIRQELKIGFPGVKFSVTTNSYSGGESVRVSWTDGPTRDQVGEIIDRYQYGHFDGMTDCYEYSNTIEGLPQVKFVFADRELSNSVYDQVFNEYLSHFTMFHGKGIDEGVMVNGSYRRAREDCWRILGQLDLREPLTVERMRGV